MAFPTTHLKIENKKLPKLLFITFMIKERIKEVVPWYKRNIWIVNVIYLLINVLTFLFVLFLSCLLLFGFLLYYIIILINTDVDNFLSNTLKKEKLKRDTNTEKEALLNELNELQNRLPEKIEKDLDGKLKGCYLVVMNTSWEKKLDV